MYSTLHYVQYIKHIVHSLGAFVHNLVKEMPHCMFVVLTIIDSNMIVIGKTFLMMIMITFPESTQSVG